MSKMAEKLFGNSPKMERGKDGKMGVTSPKKVMEEAAGDNAQDGGIPMAARHAGDRMAMHHKHEMEHAVYDAGKVAGSKEEMHARHREEMVALHKRHEKEHSKK